MVDVVAPVDPDVALIADLVPASRVLENEASWTASATYGALGKNPDRFYVPRAMAPGLSRPWPTSSRSTSRSCPFAKTRLGSMASASYHSEIYTPRPTSDR